MLRISVLAVIAAASLLFGVGASERNVQLPQPPVVTPQHGITTLALTAALDKAGKSQYFYRSSNVPPIVHIVPGGQLRVTLANHLPFYSHEQCAIARCMDMTNLHFHGLEVSPKFGQDDILTMLAAPTETLKYDVHVPIDVPPGLYWYHPHPHGESDRQVMDGMSGAIVVDGIEHYVPQLRTMPERVLVLRTAQFQAKSPQMNAMSRLVQLAGGAKCRSENEQPDEIFNVNGAFRPSIAIAPGERQFWRIVNASADNYTDLKVDGSTMQVVALDGMPLALHDPAHPLRSFTHIVVPPAGRVEAIVTGPPAGMQAEFRTYCVDSGPAGDPMRGQILADIAPVHDSSLHPLSDAAPSLRPIYRPVNLQHIEQTPPSFDATFTEGHHKFYINKQLFSINQPTMATVPTGTYVHWRVLNKTHEIHPFHIHQVHFLTYAVNGRRVGNPVWTDLMNVPLEQSIDVILDTTATNIRGLSVFHCHILSHEDKGMMAKVRFK
jgi:suppressor of ftsI